MSNWALASIKKKNSPQHLKKKKLESLEKLTMQAVFRRSLSTLIPPKVASPAVCIRTLRKPVFPVQYCFFHDINFDHVGC